MIFSPPPVALTRAPRTDLIARASHLDELAFAAVDAVADRLARALDASTSIEQIHLLTTQVHMLRAMQGSHRSAGRLVAAGDDDMEASLDALPIVRLQLERCFLALLLADHPAHWHRRYRKNAWKAFAEKFFRDQRTVGHLEPFGEYFAASGPGIRLLRDFAREMDVNEDELQTVRQQVTGDQRDPRFAAWFIADMPTPGRCIRELRDPACRALAELLYPCYDNLSHFSHGGLVGAMQGAILRSGAGAAGAQEDRRRFWRTNVLEQVLPVSYVALLLVATLFARPYLGVSDLRDTLLRAWRPYHSDGSPLGVAVWDNWAALALQGEQAREGQS